MRFGSVGAMGLAGAGRPLASEHDSDRCPRRSSVHRHVQPEADTLARNHTDRVADFRAGCRSSVGVAAAERLVAMA